MIYNLKCSFLNDFFNLGDMCKDVFEEMKKNIFLKKKIIYSSRLEIFILKTKNMFMKT